MNDNAPHAGLRFLRWLLLSLCASGCVSVPCSTPPFSPPYLQPVTHIARTQEKTEPTPESPKELPPASDPVALAGIPARSSAPVPIGLDTVFSLAASYNPQIAQAREKVNETCLTAELAAREACLPSITAGLTYYRHEGGIQNENGTLTNSSTGALFPGVEIRTAMDLRQATFARVDDLRKQVQSRAELTRITNDLLLEAATTYVDLLTARRAEAVVQEAERYRKEMQARAEKFAEEEPATKVFVEACKGEVTASQQMLVQLRQQGDAAAAKLAYLLGLGCESLPTPIDGDLVPLELVDVAPSVEKLVARVQEIGPGVREIQELLAAIQTGLADANSPGQFLPTVQLSLIEGPFAAGPGGTLGLSNRLDLCLSVKWNLTEYLTAREKQQIAASQLAQVEHGARELRNKLSLAVQEARDTIYASRARFRLATEQIRSLAEVYRLSRFALLENLPGTKPTDVLIAVRGLEQAHLAHLQTVQSHNKAQLRLLMLLGK